MSPPWSHLSQILVSEEPMSEPLFPIGRVRRLIATQAFIKQWNLRSYQPGPGLNRPGHQHPEQYRHRLIHKIEIAGATIGLFAILERLITPLAAQINYIRHQSEPFSLLFLPRLMIKSNQCKKTIKMPCLFNGNRFTQTVKGLII